MNILQLKPCTPEDVTAAVPLIYASGPDAFEFVFKNDEKSAKDFLAFAFLRKGGEFSFDNHYALWENNQLVGVGALYNHSRAATFLVNDAVNIIRFYGWKFLVHSLNGLKAETIIKPPGKNEITLGHLGIKEELRGKGFGTHLINLLVQQVEKMEQEYFVLDVSEENPKAKVLYERMGFTVVKKYESTF